MKIKEKLEEVIFNYDTPLARTFDVVLLVFIVLSVFAVVLESVSSIAAEYGLYLKIAEWIFTIFFTIEYITRIYVHKKKTEYIFSFFGIIDFLAVIPTYLSLLFAGVHMLIVIRILRLLRIFRILKLVRFLGEELILFRALKASMPKITVFLVAVVVIVLIIGTVMFMIEGPVNGFANIPVGVYWAIVTMTTVGYGDLVPQTVFGKMIASIIMILGYGIIAVPTGIVSVELHNEHRNIRKAEEELRKDNQKRVLNRKRKQKSKTSAKSNKSSKKVALKKKH